MKILLTCTLKRILTPSSWRDGRGMDSFNYGLACIAAAAEQAGHHVECIDLYFENMSEEGFVEYLKDKQYEVVGITFYTPQMDQAQRTARIIKKVLPNTKLVMGGVHVSSVPEEVLKDIPECDVCVIGEGDVTFTELLGHFKNKTPINNIAGIAFRDTNSKVIKTSSRPLLSNLNLLPIPAYHLFPVTKYKVSPNLVYRTPTISLQITRGCPYKCAFCEYTKVGGSKIRHKDIRCIVDEIKHLHYYYGFKGIVFRDSALTINHELLTNLCEAFIDDKLNISWMCYSRVDLKNPEQTFKLMKKAGCWQIGFGCESGNQKTLDLLQKGTTLKMNNDTLRLAYSAGLSVSSTWMLGLPGEDESDVLNTINFAVNTYSHIAKFFLPVPYPGTELERFCRMDEGLNENAQYKDYDMFNQDNPIYVNPRIGKNKSIKLLKYAYKRFYSSPYLWLRNLNQIKDVSMIKRYIRGLNLFLRS